MNILLIYPPFGETDLVHLAMPLLIGHLRSKRHNVSFLDANLEFYRSLLTHERIEYGRKTAEERFGLLKSRHKLTAGEKFERKQLKDILVNLESISHEWRGDKNGSWDTVLYDHAMVNGWISSAKRGASVTIARTLAGVPYYPERFARSGLASVVYRSTYSDCSIKDIIESVKYKGMLDGFYEKILPPILERDKPSIIGISVSFESNVQPAFRCASVIKKIASHIHITLGGSWISTVLPDLKDTRFFNLVDSFVIDEGEIPLEKLAQEFSSTNPDLGKVPGLMYIKDGRVCKNPPPPKYSMESFPPPDYTSHPFDRHFQPKEYIWLSFRTSKGCYWKKCVFCPTCRKVIANHEQASAEYTYYNVRTIMEQTGMRNIGFVEEASSPDVLEDLSKRIINSKLSLNWATNVKLLPDITLERCMTYKKSGCFRFNFGLETYNDRLLGFLRKGITTKTIDFALSNISWAGMTSLAYMMIGLPTETEEEALKSFNAVYEMQRQGLLSHYSYGVYELMQGSHIFNNPDQYGIRLIPQKNKDHDLPNRYYDFSGTPISRDKAWRLTNKFNAAPFQEYKRKMKKTV